VSQRVVWIICFSDSSVEILQFKISVNYGNDKFRFVFTSWYLNHLQGLSLVVHSTCFSLQFVPTSLWLPALQKTRNSIVMISLESCPLCFLYFCTELQSWLWEWWREQFHSIFHNFVATFHLVGECNSTFHKHVVSLLSHITAIIILWLKVYAIQTFRYHDSTFTRWLKERHQKH